MSHHPKQQHQLRSYLSIAQSAGILVCLFFILMIAGQFSGMLPLLPFLLVPMLGYILTWYKETLGAAIMITGSLLLMGYLLNTGDTTKAITFTIPFLVSGGLFVLHLIKKNELKHK